MARYSNKDIQRIVKNFNARVKRLENYGVQYLPEHETVRELKRTFANQRDLNRRLRQLENFSRDNATNIVRVGKDRVKMSEWQRDNFYNDRRVAKRRIEREIGDIQNAISNRARKKAPVQTLKQEYLTQRLDELEMVSRPLRGLSRSQVRTASATAEKEVNRYLRDATFKNNFFDMMFKDAKFTGQYDKRIMTIRGKLSKLSPNQLLMAYYAEPALKHFVEYYGAKDFAKAKEADESEVNKMDANIDNLLARVDSIINEFKDK